MIKSKVKTKEGTEPIIAYTWDEAPLPHLRFSKMSRNKKVYLYADEYACLDTETAHDNLERGWIYQWALTYGGVYIYGRTPMEFINLLERMREEYGLHGLKQMIIYIHNASYDLQYLKHYLKLYDDNVHFMAIDNHTILICDVCGFRVLCSYKLSNMSLELFADNYADTYAKASGEINYNVVRYQDDELTESDWFYQFSDVAAQHDAIRGYLSVYGYDKAYKAPFTSTGFVRVDSRKASEHQTNWRQDFNKGRLSLEQYNLCRQAFMGGLTICSYEYAGETVEDVGHKDFTSSYPARQMMDYFPAGKPDWYGEIEDADELSYLLDTYCCVFIFHATHVQLKPGITAPYIPSSKCFWLKGDLKLNGKIVYADELAIAITEIDYKWIQRQYTFDDDVIIDNMLIFERGPAPNWLKSQVMKFYKNKCTLKHSDPRLYMASKGLLNSIYGMSATAIVREEFEADENLIITHEEHDAEKQLNKFYASYNSFMPYQLGLYTTAHARDALMEMIEAVGYGNFLYCDTDSVFYKKSDAVEERLAAMNAQIRERAITAGAYVDDNILGVATDEAPIRRFRGLHAKCYAAEELGKDGEFHLAVTIAGIPKRSTKWINGVPVTRSNAEELGSIDNLQDGFIFRHCGGTRCIYNETKPTTAIINGHRTEYASSAIIDNIEKEISDTMFTLGKDYTFLDITQERIL